MQRFLTAISKRPDEMDRKKITRKDCLCSVLNNYKITIDSNQKITWNCLINNPVEYTDIDRLIYVIGIQGDKRKIIPKDRHLRVNRHYKWVDCAKFNLDVAFDGNKSIKENKWYLLLPTGIEHDKNCKLKEKNSQKVQSFLRRVRS